MGKNQGAELRLWRWRHNQLKRRSDIVEGWVIVSVWALAVSGGAVTGAVAAHAVADTVEAQQASRHTVPAVLTADAPALSTTETGAYGDQVRAPVRWMAQDGASRTGMAQVKAGTDSGTQVRVWVDRNGTLAPAPLSAEEAVVQAGLAGGLAALGAGGAVILGGWAVRAELERRRIREWEREWEQIGPTWRRMAM